MFFFFGDIKEKKNNLWQSDFHSVCFLFVSSLCPVFLSFFCSFLSFSLSSFKVNLKVHHRNWRVVLLLAPTRGKKKNKKQKKNKNN